MSQYWLDLFTPETWEEARSAGFKISGFRETRWSIVSRIEPGDLLICYITKISRFSGILEVISKPYVDKEKAGQVWRHDSFPCLMDVKPIITLDFLHSIPTNEVIPKLSISPKWGGLVRGSPKLIPFSDGEIIRNMLKDSKKEYPLKKVTKITSKKPRTAKTQQYGAPMDFRGLRHAPINEQGVVYIFALVAGDLGFTVEAIGTRFPDCEAMRRVSGKRGDIWQRVHIEFEYYSSDFRRHNHPIEGCDVIACWKHDWKECPIEVIELSEVITKLGARLEK